MTTAPRARPPAETQEEAQGTGIAVTCYSPRDGVLCFYSPDSDHTAVITRLDDHYPVRPACYELLLTPGPACAGELPFWWVERRAVEWIIAGSKERP